jgi:hypothetical protein
MGDAGKIRFAENFDLNIMVTYFAVLNKNCTI